MRRLNDATPEEWDQAAIQNDRSELTTIVVADKTTGGVWGGVWGDPTSLANKERLNAIRVESGNYNYTIMLMKEAQAIETLKLQLESLSL